MINYDPWARLEFWSVKTFLFLCEGKNPAEQPHVVGIRTGYIGSEPPTPQEIFERQIDKAGKEGALSPRGGPIGNLDEWEFTPRTLVEFAHSVGFPVTDEIATLVSDLPLRDSEIGQKQRQRMASMGKKRQAEAADKSEWWKPYIAEGNELVARGKSKTRAAQIVKHRHPEAGINVNTLRTKLKS